MLTRPLTWSAEHQRIHRCQEMQRAVWDLGMMFHQNESQAATTVKEARVICSQIALDIQTACSQSIIEARTGYLVVVKEAKTTRSHLLQETEATCSKAICEAEAWKISQAAMLHKEHGKYMWDLEEQSVGGESRSCNDFLTACQVILYSSPPLLKSALTGLIPHPTWANISVASTHLTTEDIPHGRTTNHYCFTHTGAQTIS